MQNLKKKLKFKVSLINLIKTQTKYIFELFLFRHPSAQLRRSFWGRF